MEVPYQLSYVGVVSAGRPSARTFEEHGDEVVVGGSVRLQRPSGGFAESQIS